MGTEQSNSSQPDLDTETVIVRIQGPDRPGITAGLMELLAAGGADLLDTEQIIIRGRLNLSLLITVPPGQDLIKDLLLFGWQHQVDVDFEVPDAPPTERSLGLIITVLGDDVTPGEFGAVAAAVARHDGNIDRIVRLARYPVMAYELLVTGAALEAVRQDLLVLAHDLDCDIAVHREGLGRRASRLIVLDVDSTLIQNEIIDLVAAEAGCSSEVSAITEEAMAGRMDFETSLTSRVALLAGLDQAGLDRALTKVKLTPGARTFIRTLNRLGFRTAIVSGGFTTLTSGLAAELGIDHAYANTLEIVDGMLTGKVVGRIIDRQAKADILRAVAEEEGIPVDQVVAVGDGANDLEMLNAAGLGIAFNAKPVVAEAADMAVNVPYLDAILFVLGVRRGDIEAADLAAAEAT